MCPSSRILSGSSCRLYHVHNCRFMPGCTCMFCPCPSSRLSPWPALLPRTILPLLLSKLSTLTRPRLASHAMLFPHVFPWPSSRLSPRLAIHPWLILSVLLFNFSTCPMASNSSKACPACFTYPSCRLARRILDAGVRILERSGQFMVYPRALTLQDWFEAVQTASAGIKVLSAPSTTSCHSS